MKAIRLPLAPAALTATVGTVLGAPCKVDVAFVLVLVCTGIEALGWEVVKGQTVVLLVLFPHITLDVAATTDILLEVEFELVPLFEIV